MQQGNPELLTRSYETAHNRVQVEGLVDTQYTLDNLHRTIYLIRSPGSTREDRLLFNPHGDETQACFIGANMAICKATPQRRIHHPVKVDQ
jgi:hypothetical protein